MNIRTATVSVLFLIVTLMTGCTSQHSRPMVVDQARSYLQANHGIDVTNHAARVSPSSRDDYEWIVKFSPTDQRRPDDEKVVFVDASGKCEYMW